MDSRPAKKGRLYCCVYCEKAGKSYKEARYRVIGHVLKHHRSLDETPYYCSLCMFRCTTLDALKKHVTSYKRHTLMAQGGHSDSSRFLVENPSARSIDDGTEVRVLTLREQYCTGEPEEDPLSIIDECLLNEFDALDEQLMPSVGQSNMPTQTCLANRGSAESQKLTVQITPEMFSQFGLVQPAAATAHGSGNLMMQHPPPIQRQVLPPQPSCTQVQVSHPVNSLSFPRNTVPTTSNIWQAPTLTQQPAFNQQMPSSLCSTPLMDEPSNTIIGFPTIKPVTNTKEATPKSTQLNTPKPDSPENIMGQLLEKVPNSPTFSEVGATKSNETQPPIMVSKLSQTDPKLSQTPEPKRARTEDTTSRGLLETLGKITSAIDWNSRAIRNQDKTLCQVVDVLSRLSKSVENIADDLHKRSSSPQHKENASPRSPNRKVLKSVVKKK